MNNDIFKVKRQVIKDPISGLTLKFSVNKEGLFNLFTIYGNFKDGNRDFYFDKSGDFAGTGTAVGECQGEGS
ncbi:MAG TPA: hypothetical protein VMX96_03105 [Dehalococcoidia bacterium]|nr:hypothetical protein [Dehalococcoidia bacterium]